MRVAGVIAGVCAIRISGSTADEPAAEWVYSVADISLLPVYQWNWKRPPPARCVKCQFVLFVVNEPAVLT